MLVHIYICTFIQGMPTCVCVYTYIYVYIYIYVYVYAEKFHGTIFISSTCTLIFSV